METLFISQRTRNKQNKEDSLKKKEIRINQEEVEEGEGSLVSSKKSSTLSVRDLYKLVLKFKTSEWKSMDIKGGKACSRSEETFDFNRAIGR